MEGVDIQRLVGEAVASYLKDSNVDGALVLALAENEDLQRRVSFLEVQVKGIIEKFESVWATTKREVKCY
jgi:hypothetical protein